MIMSILLLSLITQDVCKTTIMNKGDIAPCAGILIDKSAAESTMDIVQNLYPRSLEKIGLLDQTLKIDDKIIADLQSTIVILKKDVQELLVFSKNSVLSYDSAQKWQSVIIGVTALSSIVVTVLVMVVVGYLARSFSVLKIP